ncbi:uncharacterized protein LOC129230296 [Uloborus diversus]|uniref:uncharacterized protein LOC129230296 n=1 Tax=Uloborus diversus TaxID=327109 RepID=UPI00240A08D8|nr:uncharacterized protein LOC129230296 [Uloborus diversus]
MPDKENTINGLLEKHHAEIFNFPIVVSCMTHEEITEKETDFYRNNVMITKEAAIQLEKETRGQGHGKQRDMWLQARKIRITGSNSYGLYTYVHFATNICGLNYLLNLILASVGEPKFTNPATITNMSSKSGSKFQALDSSAENCSLSFKKGG